MNIKRYINEILVALSLLLLIGAYFYKNHQVSTQIEQVTEVKRSLSELKEVVALKKIWGDKKIGKKVESLKTIVPASKVKWSKKQNKITATYKNLSPNELNKLITKILNTPVVIRLLDIIKTDETYNVEFKCKW
jgi:hypothetical protein